MLQTKTRTIVIPLSQLHRRTENIRCCKSKRANTKNNDNKQDRIPLYIDAIRHQHLQKNRKIIIKSNSNKSERNEISDITDKNSKEK